MIPTRTEQVGTVPPDLAAGPQTAPKTEMPAIFDAETLSVSAGPSAAAVWWVQCGSCHQMFRREDVLIPLPDHQRVSLLDESLLSCAGSGLRGIDRGQKLR
jgi:hypothetical protein